MKRRRPLLLILLGMFAVAAGLLRAELQTGYYTTANLGRLSQPARSHLSLDATYGVPAYSFYQSRLSPGEGRQDVQAYCSTCHSTRYITMQSPLPGSTWKSEVDKMAQTFGMSAPADARKTILRYLQTHYTPRSRKQ